MPARHCPAAMLAPVLNTLADLPSREGRAEA